LLERLDSAGFDFQIVGAFWKYEEEREAWRLYLVSPRVGVDGPLALYRQIRPVLDAMPPNQREDLDLADITLVRPDALDVREMKQRYGSVQGHRGTVVRRTSIACDEAFIYRL